MGIQVIKLPLPGTALWSLKVMVPMSQIDLTRLSALVPGVTKIQNVPFGLPTGAADGAKNYLYTGADDPELYKEPGTEGPAVLCNPLYFGPDRNSGAAPGWNATPDKTFEDIMEHYDWPPVLTDFILGVPFSGSYVGSNPRVMPLNGNDQIVFVEGDDLLQDHVWKNGFQGPTRVKIEQWWSAVPWAFDDTSVSERRFDRMHPTIVEWDVGKPRGIGQTPPCLHGEVLVPGLYEDRSAIPLDDINLVHKVIEATKFTDWAAHVIKDGQRFVNGMWLRERVTAYPPHVSTYTA